MVIVIDYAIGNHRRLDRYTILQHIVSCDSKNIVSDIQFKNCDMDPFRVIFYEKFVSQAVKDLYEGKCPKTIAARLESGEGLEEESAELEIWKARFAELLNINRVDVDSDCWVENPAVIR
ncbi:hypothetical protein QYM36_008433 [Artemia franciscana]|uniref:Uncharacterized protein n=1 Tax=Artemia franciscana TaxID=6661 RepID=A0AA88IFX4_ARTSF|nr:hypothetical protein QYM36_008433 [Artemia franciscana]